MILKTKLYKHHFISIAFTLILGIVLDIILNNYRKGEIIYNLLNYLIQSIYSLIVVLNKYIKLKKYIQSYELLFFEGLIESILGIITLIKTINIGYW